MVPPLYSVGPSAFMPRMISMPVMGLFLRSSLHLSQTGLGLLGLSSSTIRPVSVPLAARLISTMDFGLPVWSSIVFHRPTASAAAADIDRAISGAARQAAI